MADMATLHLRNVPEAVYAGLRRRAKQHGRSMNAEAVALLAEAIELEHREGSITDELRRIAFEINLPPDAPKPEEIIRQDRDSR
jgi:plasmid stability protein